MTGGGMWGGTNCYRIRCACVLLYRRGRAAGQVLVVQQQLLLVGARFIIICPMYCSGIDPGSILTLCTDDVVAP